MSRVKVNDTGAETLPASSVARNASVCAPSADPSRAKAVGWVNSPPEARGTRTNAPPSTPTSRVLTPERLSVALPLIKTFCTEVLPGCGAATVTCGGRVSAATEKVLST